MKHDIDLHHFAAIVESSDDAIISKTLDGIVTSWNPAATRIFGYTAEEMVGTPLQRLFPADRVATESALLEQLTRGERIHHYETCRLTKDGRTLDVSVTISPIRDAEGRLVGASKILRDISERKRFEAEVAAARRDAEEAHRLKDEFLATLSHELRTPLTAILGWTRLLRKEGLDEESTCHAFDVIERNCKAQVELIESLLDVSRLVSGGLTFQPTAVDVNIPLLAALEATRPAALAKGVQLDVRPAEVPRVAGDSARLQQVFWNILCNSVKFTGQGGQVTASVRSEGGYVEVVVRDTGVGIRPDFLPHVFDRFRQGDGSTRRAYGGVGIGLALVRHLVELHGGSVIAESAGEAAGATFTVRLPVPLKPVS